MIKNLNLIIYNDAQEPWGLFFQDNTPSQIEGLEELHNNIMFYLAIILFTVGWIMISIIINYRKTNKCFDRNATFEFVCFIAFVITLVFICGKGLAYADTPSIDMLESGTIIKTTLPKVQSLVEMLDTGIIPRTPLPDMPLMYMQHGLYDVTGGKVIIEAIIEDMPTQVYAIIPDGVDILFTQKFNTIALTNQPFDTNLGCVLYEIRAAGIQAVTQDIAGLPQMYNYIKACKLFIGESISSNGSLIITDNLINALGNGL